MTVQQSTDPEREVPLPIDPPPIMALQSVTKRFDNVLALHDVSMQVHPGEVHCLLGDNGAGKSTVIKIFSGVHQQTSGDMFLKGAPIRFANPREARDTGIATVHQSAGMLPLMSVARNFFVGAEPTRGKGFLRRMDMPKARRVSLEQIRALGIRRVEDADQLVGTLSGGERQALAIGRALYFGARVLILDEPTAALGVREAQTVLSLVRRVRHQGVAVVLVTHNAYHALAVGDRFTILIHGEVADSFVRGERTKEEVLNLMAGGEEMQDLELELEEIDAEFGHPA